ncbi:hypothetical protein [Streptomyces sp. NPDC020965]|uniref:hypothetical protein n=1 Tax=Streptomyces sp. NPDC020965 TaxID=3365105 RepID=UPI0037A16FCA
MRGRRAVSVAVVAVGLLTGCGEEASPQKRAAPAVAGAGPAVVSPPVAAPLDAAGAAKALPTLTVPGIAKEASRAMDPAELVCPEQDVSQPVEPWCKGLLYGGQVHWVKQSDDPEKGWMMVLTLNAYRDVAAARAAYREGLAEPAAKPGLKNLPVTALGEEQARFRGTDQGPWDALHIRSGTVVINVAVQGPVTPTITEQVPEYGASAVAAAQRAQAEALASKG